MKVVSVLQQFFAHQPEIVAVYLYGTYADDRTWPDSDIEIALLFGDRLGEGEISAYMEQLTTRNPLQDVPGILMPFALNNHILPVIYEILAGGTAIVSNDPAAREAFARQAGARMERERRAIMDDATQAITQARSLGLVVLGTPGFVLPQPPKYLDPIRIGWRLARILASVAMLESTARDGDAGGHDPEQLGQLIAWFSNAAGAATGIAKAMLNIFGMPRPARRWEVFLPLADAKLMTMELALQLAAAVELRWQLLTGSGLASPERITAGMRAALPPIVSCARLAAWYCDVPGARPEQKLH